MAGLSLQPVAIARAALYAAVAAAIAATALHFRRDGAIVPVSVQAPATAKDPLASELARCQTLGMAAKDDAACGATWAANRRRFFTFRPTDYQAATPPAGQPRFTSQKGE